MMRLALTGATGAVGSYFVRRLAAEPDIELWIVDRAAWDLRRPLPAGTATALQECDVIVHAAADTRLGGPAAEIRQVNVESVRQLAAAVGASPRRPRLVHVSSAFVEASPGEGGSRNPYEQSKLDAERLLRRAELPETTIFRTSLVMGDSISGEIGRFGGFYSFCRMFTTGLIPAMVGDPDAQLDFVPVDDVAEALLGVVRATDLAGAVVTVASGAASPRVGELLASLRARTAAYSGREFPPTPFVAIDRYWRLFRPLMWPTLTRRQQRAVEYSELFFIYFASDHTFGATGAAGLLPAHRSPEELLDIFDRSMAYWFAHARPKVRPHAPLWTLRELPGPATEATGTTDERERA